MDGPANDMWSPLAVVDVAVAVVTMTTWGTAVGGLRGYCTIQAHAVADNQGSDLVPLFSALMMDPLNYFVHAVLGVTDTTILLRFLRAFFSVHESHSCAYFER
jgi:hypothetical protein